jgi:hypothetical protein
MCLDHAADPDCRRLQITIPATSAATNTTPRMIQPHGVLVVDAVGSAGCSGSTGVVSGSKMVTAGAGAVSGWVVGSGAVLG